MICATTRYCWTSTGHSLTATGRMPPRGRMPSRRTADIIQRSRDGRWLAKEATRCSRRWRLWTANRGGQAISKERAEIFKDRYLPTLKPTRGAKEFVQWLIDSRLTVVLGVGRCGPEGAVAIYDDPQQFLEHLGQSALGV
jgi:hypothetical protein